MKLLDDLAVTGGTVNRRRFLSLTTLGALGAATIGVLAVSVRYLRPSVLFELPTRFRASRLAALARSKIHFHRDRKLYVIKDDRGVYAMSAVCTHLGCLTRPNPNEDGFFCPCHGSHYDLNGNVVSGPAPRPLPHYEVEIDEEVVWVDSAHQEDPDDRIPV